MSSSKAEYETGNRFIKSMAERLASAMGDERARHQIDVATVLQGIQVICEVRDMVRDDNPGDASLCSYVINRYLPAMRELDKFTSSPSTANA